MPQSSELVARWRAARVALDLPSLNAHRFGRTLWRYPALDSSNLEALRLMQEVDSTAVRSGSGNGLAAGAVIWAEMQEGGLGRMGRRWESPAGGLWFTVALPSVPEAELSDVVWLNLATALAVTEALEGLGIDGARIKWPNDVYVTTPEEERGSTRMIAIDGETSTRHAAATARLPRDIDDESYWNLNGFAGDAADAPEAVLADESSAVLAPLPPVARAKGVDQRDPTTSESASGLPRVPGRKIGGVLTQVEASAADPKRYHVAIGVGLNVNQPAESFPPALRDRATSLAQWTHEQRDLGVVLRAVLTRMEAHYDAVCAEQHSLILAGLEARSLLRRTSIRVRLPDGRYVEGDYAGLNESGHLVLAGDELAPAVTVSSGEILRARRLPRD